MALGLRKVREILQALLRAWNKKDEGNRLENAAQTASEPGVTTGGGTASQSLGTPSRPENVQTIPGRPLNAAGSREAERATQLGFGGTGTHQRPENASKGSSDPRVHADIFRLADGESEMARKAQCQEKQLPEIREFNWQRRSPTSPLAGVAT
ncbi:hypothetical protein G5V57_03630 [Nordella sp. HKS 07]|uniref:hypothetical protein n=1 Tax=Nordella sp. HKS 07 TaxID=2712222 RepID=UPI0013E18959|nr:hypothetical protein [Nordella sp. HKS 07]QIG46915.1 hypothetical protein G5V57_03630 [Nordella sp. HKS 07]